MNDIINDTDVNIDLSNRQTQSVTAQAYYYDIGDIVSREDTIINRLELHYNLINTGFTFISFVLLVFLFKILFKNMLDRK